MEDKKARIVGLLDTIGQAQNTIEDLRDLTRVLAISLSNIEPYDIKTIGMTDNTGNVYKVGNGFTELANSIADKLDILSKELERKYEKYEEDKR